MPIPIVVLPGDRYGRLTIISEIGRTNHLIRRFTVRCDCGRVKDINFPGIRSGIVISCGCYQKEVVGYRATVHGDHGSPEYRSWNNMKNRCLNSKLREYRLYGGMGVTIFQPWIDSYAAFLAYVGRRPNPRCSIDRFPNPNGNYEPGNVRWATQSEQCRNLRNSHWTIYQGEHRLVLEICDELGIKYGTVRSRRNRGVTGEALFAPCSR